MTLTRLKINEWVKRYLPAEILAILGAVLGGLLVDSITKNPVLTALGTTWGENVGYYGKILYQDIKQRRAIDEKITPIGILKVFKNIFLEFGMAEYFDSFLIRPVVMYYFPIALNNLTLGLIAGKLSADITFYIPTIISYELRKKYVVD